MNLQKKILSDLDFLDEKFVIEFADSIDWDLFAGSCDISKYSEDFFDRFDKEICWHYFDWENNPTKEWLTKYMDKLHIGEFLDFYDLEYEYDCDPEYYKQVKARRDIFLKEYSDIFNWKDISSLFPFTNDEVEEYKDQIDWMKFCYNEQIKEDVFLKYKNRIRQAFKDSDEPDQSFVKRLLYALDDITHEFVYEFKPEIDDMDDNTYDATWKLVADKVELTKEFIIEYKHELDLVRIFNRICNHRNRVEGEIRSIAKGKSVPYFTEPKRMRSEGYHLSEEFLKEHLVKDMIKQMLNSED